MEINIGVLNKQQAEATTGTKKMRLSKHANSMVFKLFTSNIYSNPIGTVVREITSNCFDSHIEAGVNRPVLIKKSYDAQTESYHISFIDYGVGMSPDRIENVYGVYFESTKRDGNDQIGGFGIGGKTPLAYKRFIGEGESEYDNSFFVITNYNGVKYYYNIYEGTESPEFSLFHKENTKECNGTEIRIPVLEKDIPTFERELVKQLYYFENIVFDGFSDQVNNKYQIIEGDTFLYRGNDIDNYIHICLGRVYYPINYSTLGLYQYDYNVPVAIKAPIGAVNVTASREQLDYSEKTISYLKKKLSEVIEELRTMLSTQYENIVTLEEYFKLKNNFGQLILNDNITLNLKGFFNIKNINLSNFRYLELHPLVSENFFSKLFTVKKYGKKEGNRRYNNTHFSGSYDDIVQFDNLYYIENNFNRKVIKQSYLKSIHERYYIINRSNMMTVASEVWEHSNSMKTKYPDFKHYVQSGEYKMLCDIQKEFFDIIRKNCVDYDLMVVPEDFKEERRNNIDLSNISITVNMTNRYGKDKYTLDTLRKFKGIVFYGTQEDHNTMNYAYRLFCNLFNKKHIADRYSRWNNEGWGKTGIMFITVAKNNVKYFQYLKNAHHISMFKSKMLYRKYDLIKESLTNVDVRQKCNQLDGFYESDVFTSLSTVWKDNVEKVIEYRNNMIDVKNIEDYRYYLKPEIDFDNVVKSEKTKEIEKIIDELLILQEVNSDVLRFIRLNTYNDTGKKVLINILKKVMSL